MPYDSEQKIALNGRKAGGIQQWGVAWTSKSDGRCLSPAFFKNCVAVAHKHEVIVEFHGAHIDEQDMNKIRMD